MICKIKFLIVILLIFFIPMGCYKQILAVTIQVPTKELISLKDIKSIAVLDLRSSEAAYQAGEKASIQIREKLMEDEDLTILSEKQTIAGVTRFQKETKGTVFKGGEYFQKLGQILKVDAIIGGTVQFKTRDRSSYEKKVYYHPRTGARMYRDVWVDKIGLNSKLELFFVRTSDGSYILKNKFDDETVVEQENSATGMYGFFSLIESQINKFMSKFKSQKRSETRFMFKKNKQ